MNFKLLSLLLYKRTNELEFRSSKPKPQKFSFDLRDCEPGITICRPKPISFLKLKEFQKENQDDENSSLSSEADFEADDEQEDNDDSSTECDEESDCSELEEEEEDGDDER